MTTTMTQPETKTFTLTNGEQSVRFTTMEDGRVDVNGMVVSREDARIEWKQLMKDGFTMDRQKDSRTYSVHFTKGAAYPLGWVTSTDTFNSLDEAMAKAEKLTKKYRTNIAKGLVSVKVDSDTGTYYDNRTQTRRPVNYQVHLDTKADRRRNSR